jgi:long-chain acyl-CoA synthetase
MATATDRAATQAPTRSRSLAAMALAACARHADSPALSYKTPGGAWASVSYGDLYRRAAELALGLEQLEVRPGDPVAIFAGTRPEWTYFHLAALWAGATTIPIYPTSSAEECRHILEDSGARVVVAEGPEQVEKLDLAAPGIGNPLEVVVMDAVEDRELRTMVDIAAGAVAPSIDEAPDRFLRASEDDIAATIYTSGTTGPQKACAIDHATWLANLAMMRDAVELSSGEAAYLFLPLAHAFAQAIELLTFDVGGTLVYWSGRQDKIADDLAETRPHYLPSVPRVFEKVHAGILAKVATEPPPKRALFFWALAAGRAGRLAPGASPIASVVRRAQLAAADRLVLSKVRKLFGGRLKLCVSGGAPLAPEILEFFGALGITILECYGMTEAPLVAVTREGELRYGSVGKPAAGVEVRIAADGEILVKGPNVFRGYGDAGATAAAFTDGWFRTGDLGRVDDEGYLFITGRKKDLIITAGGKNVSPAPIEGALAQKPYVGQAMLYGDRRPYVVALITPDRDELQRHAGERGWRADDDEALVLRPEVRERIQRAVDEVNATLARPAQIKRFALLPRDFANETGELTATMKIKRDVVRERHAALIESLYAEPAPPR